VFVHKIQIFLCNIFSLYVINQQLMVATVTFRMEKFLGQRSVNWMNKTVLSLQILCALPSRKHLFTKSVCSGIYCTRLANPGTKQSLSIHYILNHRLSLTLVMCHDSERQKRLLKRLLFAYPISVIPFILTEPQFH
jgi:hypothetical protein